MEYKHTNLKVEKDTLKITKKKNNKSIICNLC